jgi:ABC-2 type transport system ATP-binding protein
MVAGVSDVVVTETASVRLLVSGGKRLLPVLLTAVSDAAAVTSAEVVEPDLEAVFLHLTGSSLRD